MYKQLSRGTSNNYVCFKNQINFSYRFLFYFQVVGVTARVVQEMNLAVMLMKVVKKVMLKEKKVLCFYFLKLNFEYPFEFFIHLIYCEIYNELIINFRVLIEPQRYTALETASTVVRCILKICTEKCIFVAPLFISKYII